MPGRAGSGDDLARLLTRQKSHIFSLIQKFNQAVSPDQPYTRRDNIIIVTDEARRTQYGTLALFDLLKKAKLSPQEIKRIKAVSVTVL